MGKVHYLSSRWPISVSCTPRYPLQPLNSLPLLRRASLFERRPRPCLPVIYLDLGVYRDEAGRTLRAGFVRREPDEMRR